MVKIDYRKIVTVATKIRCLNQRPIIYSNEENVFVLSIRNHLICTRDIKAIQNIEENYVVEISSEEMGQKAANSYNVINHFLRRFVTDYTIALQ